MLVCIGDEGIKRSWTGLYCDVSGLPAELKLLRPAATKKPKLVTSHVFAETTHVVEALHGFACVVTPRVIRKVKSRPTIPHEECWWSIALSLTYKALTS